MLVVIFFKNISNGPDIQTIKVSNNKQLNVNAEFTEKLLNNYLYNLFQVMIKKFPNFLGGTHIPISP